MQFGDPAPGHLVAQGGGYVGKWALGSISVISEAAAQSWISSALNNSLGWGRAGVTFEQVPLSEARVAFSVIDAIAGNPGTIGIANTSATGLRGIALEGAYVGNNDLVNHEAAHSFFAAEHSPEGSISIMEPLEDPGDEWPSQTDIAQVRAWLNLAPVPEEGGAPEEPTTYFFPADLGSYITKWHVPAGAKARMTATVIDPAPALIKPVFAASHEDMLAGDYERFCQGLGTDEAGFHKSGWQDAAGSGDIYVAIVVDAEAGVNLDDLNVGLCEAQISGSGDDSSRSIAN